MIRITSIGRRIDMLAGGSATDAAAMTLLGVTGSEVVGKCRFRLSDEEAERFDALTRDIEKRLGESVVTDDYIGPEKDEEKPSV